MDELSQLRFHARVYPDHYTNQHATHRYLNGLEAQALKSRAETEGGRVELVPVRVSATTLSYMQRIV